MSSPYSITDADWQPSQLKPVPLKFSNFVTVCSGLMFLLCLIVLINTHLSSSALKRFTVPERALEIVTSQVMLLQEGLHQIPDWEREMTEAIGETGSDLPQFISWYEELTGFVPDPRSQFYLAILEGEAGRLDEVQAKAEEWESKSAPYSWYSQLLDAAYLLDDVDEAPAEILQSRLAELVPSGWFYSRVAIRIAVRSEDSDLKAEVEENLARRGRQLATYNRVLSLIQGACFIVGLLSLGILYWRWRSYRWEGLRVSEAVLPPPWSGWHGLIVMIRGGGLSSLIIISLFLALSVVGLGQNLLQFLIPFAIHLPVLCLAYLYLWNRHGLSVSAALGLQVIPGGWVPMGLLTFGLFAIGATGGWVVSLVAEMTQATFHWTDWFDQSLIQGDMQQLILPLISYTLLAPIFEELVFRGILFSTLRRRLGPWTSIIISAAVFSLAHGYGSVGSITIFLSGILWAWAYEKSGSVLPGIAAHALNNSLVCLTVLLMIRPA